MSILNPKNKLNVVLYYYYAAQKTDHLTLVNSFSVLFLLLMILCESIDTVYYCHDKHYVSINKILYFIIKKNYY